MPDRLKVCRVCLATDVHLILIYNTHLQDTFEKITNTQLITADMRSHSVCCMCHARLKSCSKFLKMSATAELLLSTILNINNNQITKQSMYMINRQASGLSYLSTSTSECFDVTLVPQSNTDVATRQIIDSQRYIEIAEVTIEQESNDGFIESIGKTLTSVSGHKESIAQNFDEIDNIKNENLEDGCVKSEVGDVAIKNEMEDVLECTDNTNVKIETKDKSVVMETEIDADIKYEMEDVFVCNDNTFVEIVTKDKSGVMEIEIDADVKNEMEDVFECTDNTIVEIETKEDKSGVIETEIDADVKNEMEDVFECTDNTIVEIETKEDKSGVIETEIDADVKNEMENVFECTDNTIVEIETKDKSGVMEIKIDADVKNEMEDVFECIDVTLVEIETKEENEIDYDGGDARLDPLAESEFPKEPDPREMKQDGKTPSKRCRDDNLRSHFHSHNKGKVLYECKECNKKYFSRQGLLHHSKRHAKHSNTQKHYCHMCKQYFGLKSEIETHLCESASGLVKPYIYMPDAFLSNVCNVCKCEFAHKHQLQRHLCKKFD